MIAYDIRKFESNYDAIFSGISAPVRELVGKQYPAYVELPSQELSTTYNKKLDHDGSRVVLQRGQTLPDTKLLISSVRSYEGDIVYVIGTKSDGKPFGAYFHGDFGPVTFLKGAKRDAAQKLFDKLAYRDLPRQLGHSWYSGTDQTFFMEDEKGNVIPAPKLVGQNNAQFTAYNTSVRGMALHITAEQASCLQGHHNIIADHMYEAFMNARAVNPKARLSIKTTMDLPEGLIPENYHYKRKPRENAYGLFPKDESPSFQISEGHYHFAVTHTPEKVRTIIKTIDAVMGVACVSMFAKYDDPRRRLVSPPGEYANKQGRVEYRGLSNAWMCHPMVYYMVADIMRKAIALNINGYSRFWDAKEEEVVDTIANSDVDRARKILTRNQEVFHKMIRAAYTWLGTGSDGYPIANEVEVTRKEGVIFNAFLNGVESIIENPADVASNWMLLNGRNAWVNSYGKQVYNNYSRIAGGGKVN